MDTYRRQAITFAKGEGAWLTDTNGKRYLDALAGISVCGLGHAHPAVTDALCKQAATLVHTSNLYQIDLQTRLAERLCALSDMEKVFFGNSGAEANEAAIKLARLYGHHQGIETPAIVVMENSFHGRTLATLSATGNRSVQAGFEPLVQGFVRAPYNDLDALRAIAANTPNVVAVLVEPIQGEGGINIPDSAYLTGIREICDDNGWLMMLDEIQTGMGRSGHWLAWQADLDARPDVVTLAKSLGNGVPIGACLAQGIAADVLQPGTHGSTFGGNPLACSAALAVIETIESESLLSRATELGKLFQDGFQQQLGELAGVTDIRHCGLLIGIELDRPCAELVSLALEKSLLINVTAEKVVRLLPPLIMSDEEAQSVISTLAELIVAFLQD